jgi:hypothetical protein
MAYAVYLDGYETLSETEGDPKTGVRYSVIQGLQAVFEMSEQQAVEYTEGKFPKLLAWNLDQTSAEVAVRRLAMLGAYLRSVAEDEPTAWDMLMRD